jgi:hypothetical protein
LEEALRQEALRPFFQLAFFGRPRSDPWAAFLFFEEATAPSDNGAACVNFGIAAGSALLRLRMIRMIGAINREAIPCASFPS